MLGKILETHWALERNIVQTHWEVGKNEKKSFFPPPPNPKTKKEKKRHLESMFGLSHWLHEIFLFKRPSSFLAWANAPCKEHLTYSV